MWVCDHVCVAFITMTFFQAMIAIISVSFQVEWHTAMDYYERRSFH